MTRWHNKPHLISRATLKTYSHLADKQRIPSEYHLLSSHMLYYPAQGGFEIQTPISKWYDQYQTHSKMNTHRLTEFSDPKQYTYASYIEAQKNKEIALDEHFLYLQETHYDASLAPEWLLILSQFLPTLRYPWHGMQMIASYLGSMTFESKMTMVCAFQTMDEMRRIQRIAYRMRMLQHSFPEFGIHSKEEWQTAPYWQPLRRLIEKLLVTYDWIESFIALNLCCKPILDRLFCVFFPQVAKLQDCELSFFFHSFWEDAYWQQSWSQQILALLIESDKNNYHILQQWLAHWMRETILAMDALAYFFKEDYPRIKNHILDDIQTSFSSVNIPLKDLL